MFVAGASSVHSHRWISFFANQGHDVTWVSLGEPPTKEYDNLRFVELPRHPVKALRPLAYARALRSLIRDVQPEVLHAHQVWIDAIIAAATRFHPLIVTPWGSDVLLAPRSRFKRPLIAWAVKSADLITCDGENTAEAVVELGVPRDRIEIVCFGTDVKVFTPDRSATDVRARLRVGTQPVVLSLRSLQPLYDIKTVVMAVPAVLETWPDAAFVLAGDGSEREALATLVAGLGVDGAVRFLGRVDPGELPDLLAAADVYVSTALSDSGLAASTAEAMASGLPVVVTDTGSVRDWIDDGVNGFVIPVQNPPLLAQRICDLLGDESLRRAWGETNRGIIVERNNYFKEMNLMADLYARVCGRPPE